MAGSKAVDRLKECFARLPGIGPKTSERLTFHLLRADAGQAMELAAAIRAARESTKVCSVCFHLDDVDPCSVCADTSRDRNLILVVEDPREVGSFLETDFRGLFHVLQGKVSSLEGIGPEDLTVGPLLARLQDGEVTEVCLATNPDLEGEATARMIATRIGALSAQGTEIAVTRLARGIPAGATIAQVSHSILSDAIEGRRPMAEDRPGRR